MKKFLNQGVSTPLAIAIIVVLVIIAGGAILAYQYYYLPKQEVNIPVIETPKTETNQPAVQGETADWKTYTNTQYGFEIKYPLKAALAEDNEDGTWFGGADQVAVKTIATISTPDSTNRDAFVIFYVATGNNAVSNCYKQNLNSQSSGILKTKEINGTVFHVATFGDSAMGGQRNNVTQYSLLKDSVCYLIQENATWRDIQFVHGATDGKQATQQELDDQNKQIKTEQDFLDSIISTFKFTK